MYLLLAILCLGLGQLLFNGDDGALLAAGLLLQLAGVLCTVRAYSGTRRAAPPRAMQGTPRSNQLERCGGVLAAVLGIVGLGVCLRVLWLDRLPFRIDGDAAGFALAATNYLGPEPPRLFATGWQAHTNLYFWLNAQLLRIFGRSAVGIRALSAVGGSLAVLMVFELGRSLVNRRVGLYAALALAVMPMHLVFSRVGTEVVQLTWLLPAVIVAVWRGWQALRSGAVRRGQGWLLLGGALAGASQYVYPGARIIPLLVVIEVALLSWVGSAQTAGAARRLRDATAVLAWLALGVGLVYGPMVRYYLDEPWTYTARLDIVSITASGWLEREMQRRPVWRILLDQAWHAYLPLVYPVGGAQLWYIWPRYLSAIEAALFCLGLIAAWFGQQLERWLRYFLIAGFGLGFALAGALTIDTPMPSRYVVFLPMAALLIGLGMDQLSTRLFALIGARRREIGQGLLGGALVAYVLGNVATYVQHDAVDTWSEDALGQLATFAARAIDPPPDAEILFLSTPLRYFEASPVLPLLTGRTGTNVDAPIGCAELAARRPTQATVLIAPFERLAELQQLHADLAGSELEVFHTPRGEAVGGLLVLPAPGESRVLCRNHS